MKILLSLLLLLTSILFLSCSTDTSVSLISDTNVDFKPLLKLDVTLDVNDIDSIYAVVTGDNISSPRHFPLEINTSTTPPSFSGNIKRPIEGDSWTVTVIMLDSLNAIAGQGSIDITATTGIVQIPILDSRGAYPTVNAGNDTVVSFLDTIRLKGTATDNFGGTIEKYEWDMGNTGDFTVHPTGDYDYYFTTAPTNKNFECVLRATDNSGHAVTDTVVLRLYNTIYDEMMLINGGSFVDNNSNTATVSSFYMGMLEVTQADWYYLMGTGFSNNLPVELVSWFDAIRYCNMLSKSRNIDTVYTYDYIASDSVRNLVCHWTNTGYRLPTEDEWEYACRSGFARDLYWGQAPAFEYEWYSENAENMIHPVGEKRSNSFGMFDMLGNVAEWCWDLYDPLQPDNRIDYRGSSSGEWRCIRGGYIHSQLSELSAGNRYFQHPNIKLSSPYFENHDYLGFRVACRAP